jgi:hypothetical protein
MNYQQGDVIIEGINIVPRKAKKKNRNGDVVVMEGEVTGHAHRIKNKAVQMYEDAGVMFIESPEEFVITHEEHNPITIDPGIYKIGQVREWDHLEEIERRVVD